MHTNLTALVFIISILLLLGVFSYAFV